MCFIHITFDFRLRHFSDTLYIATRQLLNTQAAYNTEICILRRTTHHGAPAFRTIFVNIKEIMCNKLRLLGHSLF
jgi:hypothetical protein